MCGRALIQANKQRPVVLRLVYLFSFPIASFVLHVVGNIPERKNIKQDKNIKRNH